MNDFVAKYSGNVLGVLSGFDRLVLKGSLRFLSYGAGMRNFLFEQNILLKDFASYVEQTSSLLKEASLAEARRLGRPITYLNNSQTRKEPLAQKIA